MHFFKAWGMCFLLICIHTSPSHLFWGKISLILEETLGKFQKKLMVFKIKMISPLKFYIGIYV